MDQLREDVLEVPTTSDVAKSDSGLANSTSVEPEEGKREHLPEGLCPSRQRTSQRSSSRASGKISKDPVAQGTAKKSTSIESQASPSAKTEKQSKQSLQAKTPSMQDLHSRRLEDKREDATKDPTVGHEQEQQALCEAALIMEQKRLNDRTEVLKNHWNSASLDDYNELGFNLRSNIFQGGPLEVRSLMKDSYTPDIIQKATIDPKNWHGRRTDELGKWHHKNVQDRSLQKSLKDKYREKKAKKMKAEDRRAVSEGSSSTAT